MCDIPPRGRGKPGGPERGEYVRGAIDNRALHHSFSSHEELQRVWVYMDRDLSGGVYKYIHTCFPLKVPCSYSLTAMDKLALLRYLSEFRLRVSSF